MKATVWAVSMQKLINDRWMREWYHKKPAKVWWKQKHGTDSYCVDVVLTAVTAARFTRRVERLTEAVSGRNPHHWSPVSWWGPEKCEKWGEKWVRKNRWWSGFAEVFKGGGEEEERESNTERHERGNWEVKKAEMGREEKEEEVRGKDEGRRRRRRCHSKGAQLETGRPWNLSCRRWEVKVNTQARNISTPADDRALNAELSHFYSRRGKYFNRGTRFISAHTAPIAGLLFFFFHFDFFLSQKEKRFFQLFGNANNLLENLWGVPLLGFTRLSSEVFFPKEFEELYSCQCRQAGCAFTLLRWNCTHGQTYCNTPSFQSAP